MTDANPVTALGEVDQIGRKTVSSNVAGPPDAQAPVKSRGILVPEKMIDRVAEGRAADISGPVGAYQHLPYAVAVSSIAIERLQSSGLAKEGPHQIPHHFGRDQIILFAKSGERRRRPRK
jgi:hypothetical protein